MNAEFWDASDFLQDKLREQAASSGDAPVRTRLESAIERVGVAVFSDVSSCGEEPTEAQLQAVFETHAIPASLRRHWPYTSALLVEALNLHPPCKEGHEHDWDNPGIVEIENVLEETCIHCSSRRYSRDGYGVVGYAAPVSLTPAPAWGPDEVAYLAREFSRKIAPHESYLTPALKRALLTQYAVKAFFTARQTTKDDLRHLINDLERELSLEEYPS